MDQGRFDPTLIALICTQAALVDATNSGSPFGDSCEVSTGNQTVKAAPPFGWFFTSILPPFLSSSSLHIVSPRPVPGAPLFLAA